MKFREAVKDTNKSFLKVNKKGLIHIYESFVYLGKSFFVIIAMILTIVLYPVAVIIRMVKK